MAKGYSVKKQLLATIRQSRRNTLYRMTAKRNDGCVPCFVCGNHVKPQHATLEHKTPLSKGGTDDMDNLAISHNACNHRRGDMDIDEFRRSN